MDKKLLRTLIILFVVGWVLGFLYFFQGGSRLSPLFIIFGAVYMWIPGIVGIIFAKREKLHLPYFIKVSWIYFLACLLGMGISVVAVLLSLPANTFLDSITPMQIAYILIAGYVVGLTLNMIVALGEEIFWRGYFYEKVKKLSFLKICLFTGILWGLWHAPFIALGGNYPGYPVLGTILMIFFTIGLSPTLLYFRLKGKALMVSAALHGTLNGSAPLYIVLFQSPNPAFYGPTGIVGLVLIWAIGIFFLSKLQKEFKKST